MSRKAKQIGVVLLSLMIAVVFMGCQKKTVAGEAVAPAAQVAERDLGGLEVVFGNWWADYDTATYEPNNPADERTLEWRKEIQEKYNFKMSEANVATWELMLEESASSIMAGAPFAQIIQLQPNWAMALYGQKLLAPLNAPSVDFNQDKPIQWNRSVRDAFNFNGNTYAMSVGYGASLHGGGVFYNKRLFEEAGLDPNLPYDLQKSGEWTWEKFREICEKVQRDVDNDGVIDVYAMASISTDALDFIIASNGARIVDKDSSGKFVLATNRPEFLEALQFSCQLFLDGYIRTQRADENWNYFEPLFHDGKIAMRIAQQYVAQQLAEMQDDWGFVLFPKGPRLSDYLFSQDENVCIIPSTYTPEEVDNIMFAYKLWQTPAPGNDDDNAWKASQYNIYRDTRAVDETGAMIRDPQYSIFKYENLLSGFTNNARGQMAWDMWVDGVAQNPAQLIERVTPSWQAIVEDANAEM
jgi:ABC-type glycerol-3-phosphate transport system substrate-binding protein